MCTCIEEAKKMCSEYFALHMEDTWVKENEHKWEVLTELIEHLEQIPQDDGWISVDDRKPEKDWYYNVVNWWKVHPCMFHLKKNVWGQVTLWDMFNDFKHITHWQPLPLPPK